MNSKPIVYARFNPSMGGFVEIGYRPGGKTIEFNNSALHFESRQSPADADMLLQIAAIAQIGAELTADQDLRRRCMENIEVLKRFSGIADIRI